MNIDDLLEHANWSRINEHWQEETDAWVLRAVLIGWLVFAILLVCGAI